jgi:hypothetical protein
LRADKIPNGVSVISAAQSIPQIRIAKRAADLRKRAQMVSPGCDRR